MNQQQTEQAPIADVMHKHIYTVTKQQSVEELIVIFLDNGINSVPVVDENATPTGIVSKTDIVREIKERCGTKRDEATQQVQP